MSATVFGARTYGTSDETATTVNLYTSSVSLDITTSQAWVPDHIGDEVGLAIGNKGASLSMSGILSVADNLGATIAQALAAADIANSDIFLNSTATTVFYVTGGNITRNNAGFQEGSITAEGRDQLTDATPTTVT